MIKFISISHEPVEIIGENSMVTAIKVKNKKTGEIYDYKTDGVFMFVDIIQIVI